MLSIRASALCCNNGIVVVVPNVVSKVIPMITLRMGLKEILEYLRYLWFEIFSIFWFGYRIISYDSNQFFPSSDFFLVYFCRWTGSYPHSTAFTDTFGVIR